MKLSELTQIEAQIGFLWGIIVGALASWVFILFFTQMEWYFKVFSSIGEIGIVGSLFLSLRQTIIGRRNYLEAQRQMKEMLKHQQSMVITDTDEMMMKGGNDGEKNKL